MFTRRQVGEPWYTALYRDPHTMWWAPSLYTGAVIFVLGLLVFGDTLPQASFWALGSAVVIGLYEYVGWRRNRLG